MEKKKLQIAGRCVWVWMLVLIFVLGVPHLSLCVSCLASSEALHRISGYSWWMNSNLSVRMCVDTGFILDYAMFTPVIVSVGNDGGTRWSNSHPFLYLYFPLIHLPVSRLSVFRDPVWKACATSAGASSSPGVCVCVHVYVCATASHNTMIKCFE